ncbi:hydroxymethylglutaryl-CoA reductase, degradative [Limosilactobacillus equigenerosi]|uniref:3-hydroxy-3-methylglutaryl coenzyme A reductase n=1 Tax=Limosilactobacillus equigenerosi DSM 18793 = JCM 14505 TaxID=1423742 RepID=A0A0R1UUJ2_9LACO|nr:hydroxymethylglutaryl-CoA reductase, degradative [Limosilactobacillus equigenerosi]KRL94597.1 Hydroxymethylglutaryl-CoA reductase [Limosilactobacillus equigenerosi DSM 18793 = JCM 14505]
MSKSWEHGFYKRSVNQRHQLLAKYRGLTEEQSQLLFSQSDDTGNQLVENYVFNYQVPEGVATGLVVNGKKYLMPMATEEPSVIAAASNGAQRVAKNGGFITTMQPRLVVGQVVLKAMTRSQVQWLQTQQATIKAIANAAKPSLVQRGGGVMEVRFRSMDDFLSVDLLINPSEAMGANSVNTMAEAVKQWLLEQDLPVLTAILSNNGQDSVQTVTARVNVRDLATMTMDGQQVATRIADLSALAQVDVYRAVTHNKGIMNGIDAALLASGNDWRANEAAAHAYASRSGQYRGLSQWQLEGDELVGTLTMPLQVGVVGGSIKVLPQSKLNYQLSQIQTAAELASVILSLGLAQNLAALRALASTGIQAGHMQLQYRALAMQVGATTAEIEPLVKLLRATPQVDTRVAERLLAQLRGE